TDVDESRGNAVAANKFFSNDLVAAHHTVPARGPVCSDLAQTSVLHSITVIRNSMKGSKCVIKLYRFKRDLKNSRNEILPLGNACN
ncbi:hypothetical protein KIN20_026902, partial [Parelaphostrongylus tenuis]